MSATGDKLQASVRVRLASKQKRALRRIARAHQLKEADIIRAALRQYLEAENNYKPAATPELEPA